MSAHLVSRSQRFRLGVGLAALMAALPAVALAQTTQGGSSSSAAPAPSPAPAQQTTAKSAAKAPPKPATNDTGDSSDDDTTVVTVTADKPIIEHKIDRDIYDVKQDPMAATGSAADVLNNVPAVTVDNDGTVSLRGNSGVQVYVNGKKSAQMQGDNRSFTLQSLAADDIDTIEVIPNPGAAFGSDTAGGIINIVMKRGRSIRPVTSINVAGGDMGRGTIGVHTGKNFGKLHLSGSLNLNHGTGGGGRGGNRGGGSSGGSPKSHSRSDRIEIDPTTGDVIREDVSNNVGKSSVNNLSANLSAEYDFTDSTDLTGDFSYSNRRNTSNNSQDTQSYDGNHNLISDLTRLDTRSAPTEGMDFRLTFDHRGQVGSTEDFKMSWSHSNNLNHGETVTRTISHSPLVADSYQTAASKTLDDIDEFSGDWSHPLGDYDKTQQQIQLGWSLQDTVSNQYDYRSLQLPAPVQPPSSPLASSVRQFNDDQKVNAAYITYQRQLLIFGFQAGLRVEEMKQTALTTYPAETVPQMLFTRETMVYTPNMIFSYKMTDADNFRLTYSRRISRPSANQLNPLIVFSTDGLSAHSGNAALHPATTDKYDFTYGHDTTLVDIGGSVYLNDTTGNIEAVSSFLPSLPDVLLTTYENAGSTRNTGFSGYFNAHTTDRVYQVNFSPNYGYTVWKYMDPSLNRMVEAQGPNSSASLRFIYKPVTPETFTAGFNYTGKRVSVDGYQTGQTVLNLSWVHQFIQNKFVLTANLSNVLLTRPSEHVNASSVQRGFSGPYDEGATFMLSLRYTFGQVINRQGNRNNSPRREDGQGGGRGGRGGGGGGYGGGGGGGRGGGFDD